MKVIGYGRCSTAEQAKEGVSIETQKRQILAAYPNDDVLWLADEGVSGSKDPSQRPALKAALALLEAGEAELLAVAKVDRASRTVADFADLLKTAEKQGWSVAALEFGSVDTRSPMGKAMVHMAAVFAELERDFISSRTRDALAVKKLQGVQLGRRRTMPADIAARICREYMTEKRGLSQIARRLNDDAVPTAQGGKAWMPGTIRALLTREGIELR